MFTPFSDFRGNLGRGFSWEDERKMRSRISGKLEFVILCHSRHLNLIGSFSKEAMKNPIAGPVTLSLNIHRVDVPIIKIVL